MAKALEDLTPEIIAAIEAGHRPCEILAAYPIGRTKLYQLRLSVPTSIKYKRSAAQQQAAAQKIIARTQLGL